MSELLTYAGIAIIAMWIGWHIRGFVILTNMAQDPDRMIKILQEIKRINEGGEDLVAQNVVDLVAPNEDAAVIDCEIDRVKDTVYLYNKANGQFIAQAASLMQAMAQAQERFPNKKFRAEEAKESSRTA